jgi:peroxiredoxin
LRLQADVYVINSDTPESSRRLKQLSGIRMPVLLDRQLAVPRRYDMLPKEGQPMGGMTGVAQMGWVIVDAGGTIRVQRVDIRFGSHASQMLEVLRLIALGPASRAAAKTEGGSLRPDRATIADRSPE